MSFVGKVAVVTGAGSGIGRAVALKLAKAGAIVALNGRDQVELEAVAAEIAGAGQGEAHLFPGDVSRREIVEGVMDAIGRRFGRIDLAFNNAGGHADFKPLHLTPAEEGEWVIDLNFKAVYFGMRQQLQWMVPSGEGAIVNAGSIFGMKGAAGIAHYVAAKHAVVGATRAAALDYASTGIRINAICPGATLTPNLLSVTGGDPHALDGIVPKGRLAQPEEIANAVIWLMSDEARYVTGTALSVDGGMIAG